MTILVGNYDDIADDRGVSGGPEDVIVGKRDMYCAHPSI